MVECSHRQTRVCYKINTAQIRMWCRQCLLCGERVGNWIPKGHPDILKIVDAEPFDETLQERKREEGFAQWQEEMRRQREALAHQREQEYQQQQRERQAKYEAYLRTPQWRAIRDAVLKRANGVCEGCGKQRATQVHHLTYEHICNEFLWELRAVCRDCHQRVHGIDAQVAQGHSR